MRHGIIRGFLASVAFATLALGLGGSCHAALVVIVPNVTAGPGSTGAFDVTVTNTNPTGGANFNIEADQLQLSLPASGLSGVQFTNVTINISPSAYIFVKSGTIGPPSSPLSASPFPGTSFITSDVEFQAPGFRAITPGATFGIAHVLYSVAANATGSGRLVVGTASNNSQTAFVDSTGAFAPFSVSTDSGLFSVTGVPGVPEPSSLALLGLGGLGLGLLLGLVRRGRKA